MVPGNKFSRKYSRAKAKIIKEGFVCSDNATKHLVISNAGVSNGVRRHHLEEIISDFESLQMPTRKSYAIVSFRDEKTAEKVAAKLQGYVHRSDENLASAAATFYVHLVQDFNGKSEVEITSCFGRVPGLEIIEDFMSISEELKLLNFLKAENPVSRQRVCGENILKNRQVWHYGYEFRYKYSDVDPTKPLPNGLPSILTDLIQKMKNQELIVNDPNQITINKYEPGHGIPPHIDNPEAFDEDLLSISLGTQTTMDFRKDNRHIKVVLRPRSLISFKDESRYNWTHGITPRKVDLIPSDGEGNLTPANRGERYSITFRRVRDDYKGPNFSETLIDSVASQPANETEAGHLEDVHVRQVYNEIASHFTATREKPWPKVVSFIQSLQPRSIVLDVGCGSGRYLGVRSDVNMVGCDKSENLIDICKEKGHEVFVCDGLTLPVKSCSVDACICIAVIHHYSTVERRTRAIVELLRVTKPGGKILVSVWAMEQEYKSVKSKYLKQITENLGSETRLKSESETPREVIPIHKNRTPFRQQDVLVPWHKRLPNDPGSRGQPVNAVQRDETPKTFHRFYHVFKKGELDDLCRDVGDAEIAESYYDEGNWCIILKKIG